MPWTSNVLPLTEPALLVATSTTVSPTLTFMPLAISSGTWILPGSTRGVTWPPSSTRLATSGTVASSRSGSTPLRRMLVVLAKLLNMAISLTRGDQASMPSAAFSTSLSFTSMRGRILRSTGRLSMAPT